MVSVKKLAPSLGISITPIELSSADGLRRAFDQMRQAQTQALLVVSGALTYGSIRETVDLALANRLPSCHGFKEAVAAGGLISLGPDLVSTGRQGARLVDKIIRHTSRAAHSIRDEHQSQDSNGSWRDSPPAFLARSDEVIE